MSEEQLDMIEDQTGGELPDDQKDFLKSLEAEEAIEDLDPEQTQAEEAEQEQQAEKDEQAAKMTALGGLSMIEFTLRRVIHPDFEFTASTKDYAVENLAPVLIKYGALIPAWAVEYEPEIKAAMAVGSLVSEGVSTAKELKAKDAAIAEAKRQSDQQDGDRVAA
ncbi:hypothetical protein [Marinomonas transparens]|uniref:Uncharacterized protein n=1 Tax=Marinomonas transparens TaxID=2795388 RepID=A0A934N315_9GAMM|nr:hypothetical protein [Marinomonas transparens]MBJ7539257.1 hypothetical protein [Marinomonas transparens]